MSVERYQPREVEVVDAEVVDEPRQTGPVRRIVPAPVVRLVRDERTRQVGWRSVKAGVTTLQGFESWAKRAFDASTLGTYRRQIKAAEAAGDRDALAEWVDRREQAVDRRHRRLMDMPKLAAGFAKILLGSVAALVVIVLLVGLAVQLTGEGRFTDIVLGFLDLIRWCVTAVAALWTPFVALAPVGLLLAAHREGKARRTPPRWVVLHTGDVEDRSVVPDEGAIFAALQAMGIAPLNKAIKEGWVPRWVQPTTRDGKGWRAQLQLPLGVTVEMVNARKDVLAHNLLRKPNETWPIEPRDKPGVLDLWVADQGILDGTIAPWPLLTDGTADYFKGVPVGIDQRGNEVVGKLMASNYLIGGIMGSGKSSLVIELVLGAALDPLVDIHIFVMAFNVDFDPLAPVLASLTKGDDDEQIDAAVEALRWLRGEVSARGKILEELGGTEAKLTREIAARDERMRPLVVVFDEVQELFEHKQYGKEARELAVQLTKKARKTGITLVWATPTASSDSLPRDLSRTASHKVAFSIGDHIGNDAILGTGSHKRGVSAVSLVAGEDVGTAMAAGFSRDAGLLRTHYIRKDATTDEITPVVQRALEARGKTAKGTDSIRTPDRPDLLFDVHQVLGGEDTRASQVAARLRDLASYSPRMSGSWLADRLHRDYGIEVRKLDGHLMVRVRDVETALAAREVTDEEALDEG
jgi:S-DNA-T family DNA segregation ATPase FtsK/SpoIIIE